MFKKILFILVLPFFLYAQWTDPRPKSIQLWHLNTSFFDSLGNVVRDSVASLSADGVTVLNDGTLKQRVFNSTTDFASFAADSAGMAVVVKQVETSGVGGGVFQWFPSGYTANGITVFAGSSGYFVRLTDTDELNVEWAGVVADNTTDQAAKIESVINLALSTSASATTGGTVVFPADRDTFYVASAININSNLPRAALTIKGGGQNRTFLRTDGDTLFLVKRFGFSETGSAGTEYLTISDMTLIGAGAANSDGAGVFADTVQQLTVKRVLSKNFKHGFHINQSNTTLFEQTGATLDSIGYFLRNNVNGNVLTNANAIANYRVGVWFSNDITNGVIIGGEYGSQPVHISAGTGSVIGIFGGNFENHDSTAIDLFSARATIYGSARFLLGGGGNVATLRGTNSRLTVVGDIVVGEANLSTKPFQHIEDQSNSYDIRVFSARKDYQLRAYNTTFGRYYYPGLTTIRFSDGVLTPDSTSRERVYNVFYANGANRSDKYYKDVRLNDTTFTKYNLVTGSHILSNPKSGFHTEEDRRVLIEGRKGFVTGAGDSTVVKIPISQSAGHTEYYSMVIGIENVDGRDLNPVSMGFNAAKDTCTVKVWHRNDTAGGYFFDLLYYLSIQLPFSFF